MPDDWVAEQMAALGLTARFNPREARVPHGTGGGRWRRIGQAVAGAAGVGHAAELAAFPEGAVPHAAHDPGRDRGGVLAHLHGEHGGTGGLDLGAADVAALRQAHEDDHARFAAHLQAVHAAKARERALAGQRVPAARPVEVPLAARAFNPREARIPGGRGGGRWTRGGHAMVPFGFEGKAGGAGHARAMEAMAGTLDEEGNGRDTARLVREALHAMVRRDLDAARRHMDGAIYQDQVNNEGGHGPELRDIRASLDRVPKTAMSMPRLPAVPAWEKARKGLAGLGYRPGKGVLGADVTGMGEPAQFSGYAAGVRSRPAELDRAAAAGIRRLRLGG